MKVMFVSAGTRDGKPADVVKNQGDALMREGVQLKHFCVGQGGLKGYISAIPRLRREVRQYKPDVVHAHYSLSAFISVFSGARPLVASIMGSEINGGIIHRMLIKLFTRFFWSETIVKTTSMAQRLSLDYTHVIPNGVDTERFFPLSLEDAAVRCGLDRTKKNVIFVADPSRNEKNWRLAEAAMRLVNDDSIKLTAVTGVANAQLVYYYNAASVVLLTSKWEGSPNVIKEAMACSRPVVATDVGDIRFLLGGIEGTYIASYDPQNVAEKIIEAVRFADEYKKTGGREYILHQGLDSASISGRLTALYKRLTGSSDKR